MKRSHAALGLLALTGIAYMAGHDDGENPKPAGQPPESVERLENFKTAGLGWVNSFTGFGQGVVAEGGEILQTGGNAAAGVGGVVQQPSQPPR